MDFFKSRKDLSRYVRQKPQGKTSHRKATPKRNIRWDYVIPVILVAAVTIFLIIRGS